MATPTEHPPGGAIDRTARLVGRGFVALAALAGVAAGSFLLAGCPVRTSSSANPSSTCTAGIDVLLGTPSHNGWLLLGYGVGFLAVAVAVGAIATGRWPRAPSRRSALLAAIVVGLAGFAWTGRMSIGPLAFVVLVPAAVGLAMFGAGAATRWIVGRSGAA